MTNDPLDLIESRRAFENFGALGLNTYRGAIGEGATPVEAFTITSAMFAGLFKGNTGDSESNDE